MPYEQQLQIITNAQIIRVACIAHHPFPEPQICGVVSPTAQAARHDSSLRDERDCGHVSYGRLVMIAM
jgi:hypothetical protein